ncbi:uncharacterized protein ColSpa_05795 [Colletotrichum spaethianum]|uniref:Uncharacterized protein n=1 Tax=Colletotrichum spaethianum TaxID=700344 RepID=A0AA37LFT5_9PEZI|nr:uncharacterized protein ColSpa_05795 [Colletotrichum spaethianum]GKT45614.1 hypothetical protein ColSpa_05795 [Colletotrichum spaethianum]
MSPTGGVGNFHTPEVHGISKVYQVHNRPGSQLNASVSPSFTGPTATTVQKPRLQGKDFEPSNHLVEMMTDQAMVSLPVAFKSNTKNISESGVLLQQDNTSSFAILTDDDLVSPTMLRSRNPSRKQKLDESDEEYQPLPKRPRKTDARKSNSRSKNVISLQSALPQPQPATQPQTGTAGTLQPVKRGRGRPRPRTSLLNQLGLN